MIHRLITYRSFYHRILAGLLHADRFPVFRLPVIHDLPGRFSGIRNSAGRSFGGRYFAIHMPVPRFTWLLCSLMMLFAVSSCIDLVMPEPEEPVRDHPMDPENPGFLEPELHIDEFRVYDDGRVEAGWRVTPSSIRPHMEYRFHIADVVTMGWGRNITTFRRELQNGDYEARISARYRAYPDLGKAAVHEDISFTVDIISTTTDITLEPEGPVETEPGLEFTLQTGVWLVEDLMAANIFLDYDSEYFEVTGYDFPPENIFNSRGRQTLEVVDDDTDAGLLEIAQVLSDHQESGVSGDGLIADIRFRVRPDTPPGDYHIKVDERSDLRNTANESILEGRESVTIIVQ